MGGWPAAAGRGRRVLAELIRLERASAPSDILYRPGAIGDALLALPALAALRTTGRAARLLLIAHPAVGELMLRSGLVDVFIGRDDPRADALFASSPERLRDALGHPAGAVLWTRADVEPAVRNLRCLGAEPLVIAPSRPGEADGIHVAQHLLDSLAPFGVAGDALAWPGLTMARAWPSPAPGRDDAGGPIVVIHPGSGSARKNWPAGRFAAVARELQRGVGARIVLLLGPADEEAGRTFAAAMPGPFTTLVQRPLVELAGLLGRCALYLGNDSGLSHLAGMSGAPTLVLFGPTDPSLWRPIGPRVQVLWAMDLAALSVDEVLARAFAMLSQANESA